MTLTVHCTADSAHLAALLAGCSIELNPSDARTIEVAQQRLSPDTEVYLTWIGGADPFDMVAASARLRMAGMFAVPHLAARYVESEGKLRELAAQLRESGVDRVLVVGGDSVRPAGPFHSSLTLMKSEILQNAGITRVQFGGFPEGNPHIPHLDQIDLLATKIDFAIRAGFEVSIVTQFGFAAEPIITWLDLIRSRGIRAPIRIGFAGPAGVLTLTRYALRCGVGNSLRVLADNPSFARLLVEKGPEPLVRQLAERLEFKGSWPSGIAGLHFFVFGALSKTLEWIEACRRAYIAPSKS